MQHYLTETKQNYRGNCWKKHCFSIKYQHQAKRPTHFPDCNEQALLEKPCYVGFEILLLLCELAGKHLVASKAHILIFSAKLKHTGQEFFTADKPNTDL